MSVHRKLQEIHGHNSSQSQMKPAVDYQALIDTLYPHNSLNIKPTSLVFPNSKATQLDAKIPFAFLIKPYGPSVAEGFPSVNFGNYPILRCNNCRAYMNPYVKFMDNNTHMVCNLCNLITKLHYSYPINDDRIDLNSGAYDIKAGQDYQARPPMPPAYFFMVDVSTRTQGILPIIGQVLGSLISEDKFHERTLFGFLTYDTVIQLYHFNPKFKQVQQYVLSDPTDNDLPIPGDLLFNIADSKEQIVGFLNSLANMFPKPQQNATQFMRALKMSHRIMAEIGGKLIIVTASSVQELKTNTPEKQKNYMLPSTPILQHLTQEMHFQYICPSIFVIPNQFMNIITLNQLIRYLNGDIFFYSDPNVYVQKFYYDFKQVMSRDYSWEGVFRIRPSIGWRVKQIYGNYSIKSNDLLSVTCTDEHKSLLYELELINPTAQSENLYIQTALLYTSANGERRIRVQNYCVPLTSNVGDIYKFIDVGALATTITKTGLYQLNIPLKIQEIQQFFINSLRGIQQASKAVGANFESLYVYWLGIVKSQVFSHTYDGSPQTDAANFYRSIFNYMDVDELLSYLVPQLYRISDITEEECVHNDEGQFFYPPQLALTSDELRQPGIYLLDVGHSLILYIGKQHDVGMCQDLFGKEYASTALTEDHMYANPSNPLNDKLYNLLFRLRAQKPQNYAPLYITKSEQDVFGYMIYDQGRIGMSYEQFVKMIG